ncbi:hypothetical protein CAFE_17490 [Caprobacter fermentans]|uniref:DUF3892 domain-containing protein n=1 Tax=Caproicibacter fermentans TaxID=2576756 RepID=A0A6N8HZY9_9FIRM|nr:DUF3892 domain-containing protein [Caproicibacter fermentans]MVB11047.1 hypothetical protein [Caproicibacter fermentans]OCN01742.1 hypothetical protein A7X67_01240 [Clostridium sp. W14A]
MGQETQGENNGPLPKAINEFTPEPEADALSITGLVKASGKITGYQLSDGRKVTRDEGVHLARENKIRGVAVAVKKGTEYLRSLPDGSEDNNLGSLPTVSQ